MAMGSAAMQLIKDYLEGSEHDMLNSARNTIKRDYPRLAICMHHLPGDRDVVRDIILSIGPSYQIEQKCAKFYAF
jgi:hypothetical protein